MLPVNVISCNLTEDGNFNSLKKFTAIVNNFLCTSRFNVASSPQIAWFNESRISKLDNMSCDIGCSCNIKFNCAFHHSLLVTDSSIATGSLLITLGVTLIGLTGSMALDSIESSAPRKFKNL